MRIRNAILALVLMAGISPAFAQAPPPVPALPDADRVTSYSLSGSNCACAVNFALYGDSNDYQNWLTVWINGVQVPFNDPVNGWVITSPTGSLSTIPRPITDAVLTFASAQTGTIQIVGARRPRRVAQFAENRGVAARDLNQVLTDIVAQNRETWDLWERSLVFEPGFFPNALPLAANRAGMYLCFGPTGQPTVCSSLGGGSISAGNGIAFTGTSPTSISTNLTNGTGITVTPSGGAEQIALANMAANSAKCNPTGGSAAPQDCTGAQLISSLGLASASFVNTFTIPHMIAPSDCGGLVKMGTGSTGQLNVTLPGSTFGFPDGCRIPIYNGDGYTPGTSTGKILVNFPTDCFYILFPHQVCEVTVSSSAFIVTRQAGRWQQSSARIFVANAGNDSVNDCMSLVQACLTISHAGAIVYNNVDNQGSSPTIVLKGGDSFHECITFQGQITGYNVGLITSSSGTGTSGGATWGNVTGACPGNQLFTSADGAEWQVQNIAFTNASGTSGIGGIGTHNTGILDVLDGVAFGPQPGSYNIQSDHNGSIGFGSSYTISGGTAWLGFINVGGTTNVGECGSCTTFFSAGPTFTTLYNINGAGSTILIGPTHGYSGSVTITNQCLISGPSEISMGGNALPGTNGCAAGASHGGVAF